MKLKIRPISSHNLGHATGNHFHPSIWPFQSEFDCFYMVWWLVFVKLKWIHRVRDSENWLAGASGRRRGDQTTLRIDRPRSI